MKKSDILIIGGGIAGLFAACLAAKAGKSVRLLSYGTGTIAIGGGIIDLLGYTAEGLPVKNPLAEMKDIPAEHPYAKINGETAQSAVAEFLELVKGEGMEYLGSPQRNIWVPTALGTFKPTCLVPRTMDSAPLFKAKHVIVLGFNYMKDFFADMAAKNLRERLKHASVEQLNIDLPFAHEQNLRDISALDAARWLETAEGRADFIKQLKPYVKNDTAVVLPPVLGLEPNYSVFNELTSSLGCPLVEISAVPPAVTGLRLIKLLTAAAQKRGVQIIRKAHVTGAEVEACRCRSVYTEGFDRRRDYAADQFILATGGIYGGGLEAFAGKLTEPIFGIDIEVPHQQTDWSDRELFSGRSQLFAKFGIKADAQFRALDKSGALVAQNLRVIGRSLAGYDFAVEKSGNGTALLTAYAAVKSICRGGGTLDNGPRK